MKRVCQCIALLVAVDIVIDISINATLDKIEDKLVHVDLIQQELADVEAELVKVETFSEHNWRDIDVVIPEENEELPNVDTEEQIAEEIRLGEMEMLAQLVHAEAGGEDLEGKRLVADVVLNRVEDGWADGTLEGVIFQVLDNGVAQFSTTLDGAYDRAGWEMLDTDYLAAKMEYEATYRLDEKIFYFRSGQWSDYGTHAYKHGGHYFSYK